MHKWHFPSSLLPKKPDRVRIVINVAMLGLKAVGICKRAKIEKQTVYNRRLPKVSDKGARIKGPMPRKTTKPVVAPITVSGEVCKSSAI